MNGKNLFVVDDDYDGDDDDHDGNHVGDDIHVFLSLSFPLSLFLSLPPFLCLSLKAFDLSDLKSTQSYSHTSIISDIT